MSAAISVKGVSKRYRIGLVESEHKTFAGQLVDMIKSPFTNLKKLRSLSSFREEDESVFWALKDISFEVQEGEVLGIIGHNGAGKSTLLKILSRITEPTSGEITIRGRVSSLLEVGTGFHPDLTGRENIYMNGTILGMRKKEIDIKLEEIIEFSGVNKYIDTPVKRYSSGMKVRLAFSVAAHLEPEVLIIDEVLAVGDAEFQAKCLGKMEDVAGQGRTVLFVSHNLAAVNSLCTRAIVLESGSKIFEGNQHEAVSSYRKISIGNQSIEFIRPNNIETPIVSSLEIKEIGTRNVDFELNTISIGSDVEIIVGFDTKDKTFTRCNLSIGIFSNDNVLIVAFKSKVQINRVWETSGNKNIRIIWKSVNLVPGEYFIKCAFGSENKIIDDISFAGRLKVIFASDLYGSGNSINQTQGYLVPFTEWHL